MVSSMTGFASKTLETRQGALTWEIKTVNHRYLEIATRLPDIFRALEIEFRQKIQQVLKRGKVDAHLRFMPGVDLPFELVVNEPLATQLAGACSVLSRHFLQLNISATDVLNWPGVLEKKQIRKEILQQDALEALIAVLEELVKVRAREGDGLKCFILAHLDLMRQQVETIQQRLPVLQQQGREKIITRFKEVSLQVDAGRLEQEVVLFLQKMDVAEELQRLIAHIEETTHVLQQETAVGRRLDFLMQELNREANTLGSKSMDAQVTKIVVELKVLIEQIREQVQNIE